MQELTDRSRFHQLFRPRVLSIDHERLELVVTMFMHEGVERQPGTGQWRRSRENALNQ